MHVERLGFGWQAMAWTYAVFCVVGHQTLLVDDSYEWNQLSSAMRWTCKWCIGFEMDGHWVVAQNNMLEHVHHGATHLKVVCVSLLYGNVSKACLLSWLCWRA